MREWMERSNVEIDKEEEIEEIEESVGERGGGRKAREGR